MWRCGAMSGWDGMGGVRLWGTEHQFGAITITTMYRCFTVLRHVANLRRAETIEFGINGGMRRAVRSHFNDDQ